MSHLKSKLVPMAISAFIVIISYFIITAIVESWIKRLLFLILVLDVVIAINIFYGFGIRSILLCISERKKYIITLIIIELCCLWMCIYKHLTINNNPIYLHFQYLIYFMIMSVIFWFFVFRFGIGIKYWKLYPILGLTFGIVFMLAIPIYVVPDEPVHLMTAYKVSNQILHTDMTKGDYLYGRAEDMELPIAATGYNLEQYSNYLAQLNAPLHKSSKYKLSGTYYLHTPQYQYYLSGLGITIGRLLQFGTIKTFLLGRLFNLLFFVSIITLAIFKTPKGKLIMMVLALTPISIQQGMSYSYDAIILPLCFLIAALSLKLYEQDCHKLDYFILMGATILLIPTKQFVYLPYALIPWLYLLIKRFSFKSLIITTCIIAVVGIISYCSINQNLFPLALDKLLGNRSYIKWANQYSYSILSLIKDPILALKVLAGTVYNKLDFYVSSLIGKDLGWFEINLPIIYPAFISLITLSVIFDKNEKNNSNKFWLNAIIMLCITVVFMFAGMLLFWTPVTYLYVEGVQGRYLITVLPLLLIFVSDKIKLKIIGNQLKSKLVILLLVLLTISTDGIMVFMNH